MTRLPRAAHQPGPESLGDRVLSRRDLLHYALLGAGALSLSGLLGACAGGDQAATPESPAQGEPPSPGGPEGECPPDGIEIGAPPGAATDGFDKTELVAPAGKQFTICFSNRDEGIPHNFAAYVEQGGEVLGATEIETGPTFQTLTLGPLDPGEYWYQCDVHPTTMTGTLRVQ